MTRSFIGVEGAGELTQMEGTGAFMQVETIRAFTETIMEITYRGIHVENVGDNDIQTDKVGGMTEGRGRGRGSGRWGTVQRWY